MVEDHFEAMHNRIGGILGRDWGEHNGGGVAWSSVRPEAEPDDEVPAESIGRTRLSRSDTTVVEVAAAAMADQ